MLRALTGRLQHIAQFCVQRVEHNLPAPLESALSSCDALLDSNCLAGVLPVLQHADAERHRFSAWCDAVIFLRPGVGIHI